jgi:hydroxymethylpyrimidine pyrophosphatase-like HAD family hydrolase
MNFVIDIDDTLLIYPNRKFVDIYEKYSSAFPNNEAIKKVNELYNKGHVIILHTGRNWDKYQFTKKQLHIFGVKHHELVMGKPQGYYIDKDSYKSLKDFENDNKLSD